MATNEEPAAAKRRLLRELRRLRIAAGQTQRDVADALDWSASKVIRIESGTVAVSTTDLRALLEQYHVDDQDQRSDLEAMAKASKRQSGWAEFRDAIPPTAISYFGYEAAASIIRQYEPLLLPGLLQTEEYTRALLGKAFDLSTGDIDLMVTARARRQEILDREEPPKAFFIVGEAAVRQQIGGPAVMRRQLERLEELGSRPDISIQVLPFELGAHPGLLGPFTLLEFPEASDDNVLYLESRVHTVTRDDPEQTGALLDTFLEMEKQATKPDDLHKILFPA